MRAVLVSTSLLLLVAASGAAVDAGRERVSITDDPEPDESRVESRDRCCGEWTVRIERIYPPRSDPVWANHVVYPTVRYWRRPRDGGRETLAYETRATRPKELLTALADGTLLFQDHLGLSWVPVDAPVRTEPLTLAGERAHVLRAWPDGLVVQPHRLNKTAPACFVPVADGALAFARKLPLTGGRGVWWDSRQFARNGRCIAWLENPGHDLVCASINLYDLDTGEARSFPFSGRDVVLCGYDGHTVVVRQLNSYLVFDAVSGERLGTTLDEAPLAERDGYRYRQFVEYVEVGPARITCGRFRLVALDLASRARHVLATVTLRTGSPEPEATSAGIDWWNGEERELVPWKRRGDP